MPSINPNIPSRLIYMGSLLDVLRSQGGYATSTDVYRIFNELGISRPKDMNQLQKSGETRFIKEVRFSRKELVDAGLIRNGDGGVWRLTEAGWATQLTPEDARQLINDRRHLRRADTVVDALATGAPRPSKGPRPTNWTRSISRSIEGQSWTYVMRYSTTEIWKIGHSDNLTERLSTINTHIPFEITGHGWSLYLCFPWPDAGKAYDMEQLMLGALTSCRTSRERVQCSKADLLHAWHDVTRSLSAPQSALGEPVT